MNTPIFNINDLALLLLIAQSVMLTVILLLVRERAGTGNGLLAGLLMTFALIAVDTLFYWSVPIKNIVVQWGIWPFWLFKWVPFIQGPLIYAYVRTRLTGDGLNWRRDAKHLLPVACYPLMLLWINWQLAGTALFDGVYDYGVWLDSSAAFVVMLWAYKVSALSYGMRSLRYLRCNSKHLEQSYSNPALAQPLWLYIVLVGFIALWGWYLCGGIAEALNWASLAHFIGLMGNYFSVGFITSLVFYSLLKSQVVAPTISNIKSEVHGFNDDELAAAASLKQLLHNQLLYLNPELTLEEFALAAEVPDRQASYLINTYLGANFFEFVNEARVARAKELLSKEDWSVQRVLVAAGFNSKATFNRIFKRYVATTPSEYRKQHKLAS